MTTKPLCAETLEVTAKQCDAWAAQSLNAWDRDNYARCAQLIRSIIPAQGAEPCRIERKVYKSASEEFRDYLRARFEDNTGNSFEWQDHRWTYQHTSFDDTGDYDLIYRFATPAREVEPVAWQFRRRNTLTGEWGPWEECPQSVYDDYTKAQSAWAEVRALCAYPTPPAEGGETL